LALLSAEFPTRKYFQVAWVGDAEKLQNRMTAQENVERDKKELFLRIVKV
jgi:hypothetical protein